jgi:uncharacterized membrane protein (GlpM family)
MLTSAVLLPLLLKVAAAALVVVAASIAAEKAGPFFGGVISTLPVSTGPAYVMLALEHDDAFIADSVLSSLVTNGTMILYLVSLVWIAPRFRLLPTLFITSTLWIVCATLLRAALDWTLSSALLLNLVCYALAWAAVRNVAPEPSTRSAERRWYDVPARALLVGVLVAAVTTTSHIIGPAATGVAAIYPIALTGLLIVMYNRLGGNAVATAMRSALLANPGFALCMLTAHLAAVPLGSATALVLALLVSLAWTGALLVWRTRPPTRRPA